MADKGILFMGSEFASPRSGAPRRRDKTGDATEVGRLNSTSLYKLSNCRQINTRHSVRPFHFAVLIQHNR